MRFHATEVSAAMAFASMITVRVGISSSGADDAAARGVGPTTGAKQSVVHRKGWRSSGGDALEHESVAGS